MYAVTKQSSRAPCTPYAVTSLSAAYAVCKTKGGLGGSPKKRRVNVETSAPRSFLKNRYLSNDDCEGDRSGAVRNAGQVGTTCSIVRRN